MSSPVPTPAPKHPVKGQPAAPSAPNGPSPNAFAPAPSGPLYGFGATDPAPPLAGRGIAGVSVRFADSPIPLEVSVEALRAMVSGESTGLSGCLQALAQCWIHAQQKDWTGLANDVEQLFRHLGLALASDEWSALTSALSARGQTAPLAMPTPPG